MKRLTKLKWVFVDLDNTLAVEVFPKRGIGKPTKGAREAMEFLYKKGYKVIIHTSRHWEEYVHIENWLLKNKIPFKNIICGKPLGALSIDDKNIEFKGDWQEVISKVS